MAIVVVVVAGPAHLLLLMAMAVVVATLGEAAELVDLAVDDTPKGFELLLLDAEDRSEQVQLRIQQSLLDANEGLEDGLLEVEDLGDDPGLGGYLLLEQTSNVREHLFILLLLLTPSLHLLLLSPALHHLLLTVLLTCCHVNRDD